MPDSESLPRFSASADPGPSFANLLRHVAPHRLPGAGIEHPMTGDIPHGTTVVAIRSANGVVMAGDRRATAGYTLANRRGEQVVRADELPAVAIAGAAGPSIEMTKLFKV